MSQHTRALDAAGIDDPGLRADYLVCRRLNQAHGRTYYLSTLLLPPAKRPYVWALYGFARQADEFVDSLTSPDPDALVAWGRRFLASLGPTELTRPGDGPGNGSGNGPGNGAGNGPAEGAGDGSGDSTGRPGAADGDAVSRAMSHTMRRWGIPRAHVEAFLDSMQLDITVTGYPTYADLEQYMYGSAAVIGLQMLPILEPLAPEAPARARALGEAFQMTNFIRDVGEDLQRGRVYLPQEDLEVFGVTRELLGRAVVTPAVRSLLEFEIERTRALYAFAEPGIEMVHPTSRPCLRTAFELYRAILDQVEADHYQVLSRRSAVPLTQRLRVAVPAWRQARSARREQTRWTAV